MAWLNELPGMGAAEDRAAKALSFPVGVVSPLWLAFGAATSAGLAFWLATRWTRQTNLEAVLEAPVKALEAATQALPEIPVASEEAVQAMAAAADPTPVVEIVLEAAEELEAVVVEAVNDTAQTVEAETAALVVAAPEPVLEAPVAETPVVEAPAALEPTPAAPDDLTRIAGIGPKLAAALAERGVTRFADLATWGESELAEVDKALSLKGRAVRDAWVAQARRFAEI